MIEPSVASISRTMPTPLHAQLYDAVLELIESGGFLPGERLPTELELADRFSVNRLTIRRALTELARTGHIVARQGAGTFVAVRPTPFELEVDSSGWAREHRRALTGQALAGRAVSEVLLSVDVVDAPAEVAEHLGRGDLVRMETLVSIDDEPTVLTEYFVRTALSVGKIESLGVDGIDADVLSSIVGDDMYYAWRAFDAEAAGRRSSEVLAVPLGSPLLLRTGLNSDRIGRPLLYLRRVVPAGRMRIVLRNRPPAE